MRNPGGYSIIVDPDHGTIEEDTFTCRHHGGVVFVKPFCDPADMGGRCTVCGGLICKACVAKGGCDPLEEQLARMESRRYLEEAMK
jgi:hypothetical protein